MGKPGDLAALRGHAAIIATCDAARSREASKELVNLLTQCLEDMGIDIESAALASSSKDPSGREKSVQEILAEEIAQTKGSRFKSSNQPFVTLQTGIKGVILAKICKVGVSPCDLISEILKRVKRDKQPVSRYIARIVPLEKLFFPDTDSLQLNIRELMRGLYPDAVYKSKIPPAAVSVEEGAEELESGEPAVAAAEEGAAEGAELKRPRAAEGEPAVDEDEEEAEQKRPRTADVASSSTPEFMTYSVFFRSRCCERLKKGGVVDTANAEMPSFARVDFRAPQAALVVEAFFNMCGAAFFTDYASFPDFNLRKFQEKHAPAAPQPSP